MSKSSHCEELIFSLNYLRASTGKMRWGDSPYSKFPSRGWASPPCIPAATGVSEAGSKSDFLRQHNSKSFSMLARCQALF